MPVKKATAKSNVVKMPTKRVVRSKVSSAETAQAVALIKMLREMPELAEKVHAVIAQYETPVAVPTPVEKYIVWNPSAVQPPQRLFYSYDEALRVARLMVAKYGGEFWVMKGCIKVFVKPAPLEEVAP